jgi:hypothetical protein
LIKSRKLQNQARSKALIFWNRQSFSASYARPKSALNLAKPISQQAVEKAGKARLSFLRVRVEVHRLRFDLQSAPTPNTWQTALAIFVALSASFTLAIDAKHTIKTTKVGVLISATLLLAATFKQRQAKK